MKTKVALTLIGGCIGITLLLAFFNKGTSNIEQASVSERINLALRQSAHQLLLETGDTKTTIDPIQQLDKRRYYVPLGHYFNYDSLPSVLHKSFTQFGIHDKYYVSVRECNSETLVLGYRSIEFVQDSSITCLGREQKNRCYNFEVSFVEDSNMSSKYIFGGLMVGIIPFLFLGYLFIYKQKPTITPHKTIESNDDESVITLGNTVFDAQKLTVTIHDTPYKLTFQEAQLLSLFVQHPNQVLERAFILKEVWKDDGVLVTRTLDVFVSRLRKILKEDSHVKIVNIHGKGYRFEYDDV